MTTAPPRERSAFPLPALLLACSALWCLLWFVHALHYWEDDSYIHLEFARSLTRGNGFSFNGHIVYGDTSPFWVYLLMGFHALIPDWLAAGKALSACGVVFAATGAWFLAYRLTANRIFAAAMVLVFTLNPFFSYWAFSGMETITAAGAAFWGAYFISGERNSRLEFLFGCAIVGIGPILRPEMSFFSAILAVILLFRLCRMPATLASKLPVFVAGFVLAAGPTLVWSLYALRTFGMLVPNTNAAKRALPKDTIPGRLFNVYALGFPVIVLALVAAIGYLIYRYTRKDRPAGTYSLRIPTATWAYLVWTGITSVFYVANHTYVQTRYVFVSASGLLLVILAVLFLNFPRVSRAAVVFTSVLTLIISFLSTWPLVRSKTESDRANDALAAWIVQNIPANAPVAMFNIGQVAYVSEHPIIDIGGITRTGVIPYLSDPAEVQHWAHREGAQYSIADKQPEAHSVLVHPADQPNTGWFLNPNTPRPRLLFNIWKLAPEDLTPPPATPSH